MNYSPCPCGSNVAVAEGEKCFSCAPPRVETETDDAGWLERVALELEDADEVDYAVRLRGIAAKIRSYETAKEAMKRG